MNKENVLRIWRSNTVQFSLDACRVLLLIIAILIFYVLVSDIKEVKILNSNVCRVCENKTGAVCVIPDRIEEGVKIIEEVIYVYPNLSDYNLSI